MTIRLMQMRDNTQLLSNGPFVENRLSNGLHVSSNHVPYVNSIAVGIWTNAGSREDPASMSGLAHFLEHAVFKGTHSRDYITIARCIEQVGGYIDAYTTKENTCLYIRCLKEHGALAFDLLADLVCNPVFPEDEIEKEKEVVIEEIHGINDSPEELIFDQFDDLAFPKHPLGPSILGTEQSVANITTEALRAFMRRHYTAKNMLITVVGNMPHDEVMLHSEKSFSGMYTSRQPLSCVRTFSEKDYSTFFTRQKKPLFQTHVLHGRAVPRNDRFFYGLLLLNTILSGGMSSMLNLELREKNALAYNAYSSLTFFEDTTLLNIYAGTDPENTGQTLRIIQGILKAETLSEVSGKELSAAKNKLRGELVMEMEKMTHKMSKAARDIFYFGNTIELEEKLAGIEKVTSEDLGQAAEYLQMDTDASTLIYESDAG
ncbi:pitrilysin family protein [Prosthecochloris sp.]|uniref:M16 family metallopeptidase n=1 Tax=Prosthecochloris sp. TaxID=290513 RepID=UPI00257C650C|nr:pitrilysin family protein [Prosthecochloris sp.]